MLIPSGQTNSSRPPKAALDCRLPIHKQLGTESADKLSLLTATNQNRRKGPLKAAPENRILTKSCGKTKAKVEPPAIRFVPPTTISAPEFDRIVLETRTAANSTDVSNIVTWIYR